VGWGDVVAERRDAVAGAFGRSEGCSLLLFTLLLDPCS
jgi:hypothetical protein